MRRPLGVPDPVRPAEGPAEHCANALAALRIFRATYDLQSLPLPVRTLLRDVERRLALALTQLDAQATTPQLPRSRLSGHDLPPGDAHA